MNLNMIRAVVSFLSFHQLMTLAVDFIRIYSKFYTDISRKLIAFAPWNKSIFCKSVIFDCERDEK